MLKWGQRLGDSNPRSVSWQPKSSHSSRNYGWKTFLLSLDSCGCLYKNIIELPIPLSRSISMSISSTYINNINQVIHVTFFIPSVRLLIVQFGHFGWVTSRRGEAAANGTKYLEFLWKEMIPEDVSWEGFPLLLSASVIYSQQAFRACLPKMLSSKTSAPYTSMSASAAASILWMINSTIRSFSWSFNWFYFKVRERMSRKCTLRQTKSVIWVQVVSKTVIKTQTNTLLNYSPTNAARW